MSDSERSPAVPPDLARKVDMSQARVTFSVHKEQPGLVFISVSVASADGRLLVGNSGGIPTAQVAKTVDYLVEQLNSTQGHVNLRKPLAKEA